MIPPDLSVNFTPIYINNNSFAQTCELNQYILLDNLQKFPKIVLYTSLAAFLIVYIYIVFSSFIKNTENRSFIQEKILGTLALLLTTNIYFVIFLTLKIKDDTIITWAALTLIAGLLISIYFSKFHKRKTGKTK